MRSYYTAALFVSIAAITVLISFLFAFKSIKQEENKTSVSSTVKQQPSTPAVAKLNEAEVDKVLLNSDMEIQTAVNQVDTELNELKNIDTSPDNKGL